MQACCRAVLSSHYFDAPWLMLLGKPPWQSWLQTWLPSFPAPMLIHNSLDKLQRLATTQLEACIQPRRRLCPQDISRCSCGHLPAHSSPRNATFLSLLSVVWWFAHCCWFLSHWFLCPTRPEFTKGKGPKFHRRWLQTRSSQNCSKGQTSESRGYYKC